MHRSEVASEGRRAPSIVGLNFKRLRLKHGKTQKEMAAALGIEQATLSTLETGRIQDLGSINIWKAAEYLSEPPEAFWSPHEFSDDEMEASLQRFLESGVFDDITEDEIADLRRVRMPWGPPPMRAWIKALEMIRAAKPD